MTETKVLIQSQYYSMMILRTDHQGKLVIWEILPVALLTEQNPSLQKGHEANPKNEGPSSYKSSFMDMCVCAKPDYLSIFLYFPL